MEGVVVFDVRHRSFDGRFVFRISEDGESNLGADEVFDLLPFDVHLVSHSGVEVDEVRSDGISFVAGRVEKLEFLLSLGRCLHLEGAGLLSTVGVLRHDDFR